LTFTFKHFINSGIKFKPAVKNGLGDEVLKFYLLSFHAQRGHHRAIIGYNFICMQHAGEYRITPVVSCKQKLQLARFIAYGIRKCRRILKHDLETYKNHSKRQ